MNLIKELEKLIQENPNDYDLGTNLRKLVENIDINNSEEEKEESNDERYIRLVAEFDNYRKRVAREKEEIIFKTKSSLIEPLLDIDNDIAIASKHIEDEGIKLILTKLDKMFSQLGIEKIQTETYDEDIHEVITVINTGTKGVHDVVSKGYKIGDKIIRYPKIILSE